VYHDVLLPTDGSEGMATVAEHAAQVAEPGATVHVLSVMDTRNRFESPSSGLAGDAWAESERERAEEAVETTAAAVADEYEIDRVVESGVPHTQILDHADQHGVDVIVMGTHGRTGLSHYLIGSVAERVVRQSPVPVLTVRIGTDPVAGPD
jgi:nucleotide-binding universal stress UspA family protein